MRKKIVGIISIVSILLSPLLGGSAGKLIANSDVLGLSSVYADDGLSYVGAIAWIVASIVFYVTFKQEDN